MIHCVRVQSCCVASGTRFATWQDLSIRKAAYLKRMSLGQRPHSKNPASSRLLSLYFQIFRKRTITVGVRGHFQGLRARFCFLSSRKWIPELKSHSSCIFISLFVTVNVYHIHINTSIYACDWITTFSEQRYSQTLTNSFFCISNVYLWFGKLKETLNTYIPNGHLCSLPLRRF